MTIIGGGGVNIKSIKLLDRFKRDYKKLAQDMRGKVDGKLCDLLANPRPLGLRFEKLKGYNRPNIYTIHITGNYKLSFEIDGEVATLRRVSCHNEIDRRP